MSQQPLETSLRNNGLNDPVAQEEMDRGSLHSHSDVEKDNASQHAGDAKPAVPDIEQDDGVTRIEALCGWMHLSKEILTAQTSCSARAGASTPCGDPSVSSPMSTRSVAALQSTVS